MKIVNNIIGALTGLGVAVGMLLASVPASAAGTGTFLVSPTGGTYNQGSTFSVTIGENSGANDVDSARAALTYNASALQVVGFSTAGNPFTACVSSAGASGGSITTGDCTLLGGKVQGYQTLATVSFKVLAGSGSAAVTFSNSSQLVSNGADLSWSASNGTYSFAAPVTGGQGGGSDSGSSSSTSSSTATNGTTKATTGSTSSNNSTSAASGETKDASTTAASDDSKKATSDSAKETDATKTADKKSGSKAWLWIVLAVIVAAVAAALAFRKKQAAQAQQAVEAKKKAQTPKTKAQKAKASK
jgi:hypothetical protein